MKKAFVVIAIILMVPMLTLAQQKDSLIVKDTTGKIIAGSTVKPEKKKKDTAGKPVFNPRKASLYSAVLPGLGQIYNKKYWKVPLVYAAVGIPVYTFFFNKTWYDRTRYALSVAENGKGGPGWSDSLAKVNSKLVSLVDHLQTNSLANYRSEFRKDMDYSILFMLLFWGLNVVDATVDAHLKGFNVNDNLSMKVKPAILSNQGIGVSLLLSFK
jgi:hypothetical protein